MLRDLGEAARAIGVASRERREEDDEEEDDEDDDDDEGEVERICEEGQGEQGGGGAEI